MIRLQYFLTYNWNFSRPSEPEPNPVTVTAQHRNDHVANGDCSADSLRQYQHPVDLQIRLGFPLPGWPSGIMHSAAVPAAPSAWLRAWRFILFPCAIADLCGAEKEPRTDPTASTAPETVGAR